MKKMWSLLAYMSVALCVPYVAHAEFSYEDVKIIRNDKEPLVRVFSKRERLKVMEKFKDSPEAPVLTRLFYTTVQDMLNKNKALCELGLVQGFEQKLIEEKLATDEKSVEDYLKFLRSNNDIDDVLYLLVEAAYKDHFKIQKLNLKSSPGTTLPSKELLEKNDINTFFTNFKSWPDEKDVCSYLEFAYIWGAIKSPEGKISKSKRDKAFIQILNEAYRTKLVSIETYNKLEFLNNKAKLDKRDLALKDYLRIVFTAKNKMQPINKTYEVKNIEDENDFTSERMKRFSNVTRRRNLYRKYDETQIILLSQIMQKASRRMGVDPDTKASIPTISQEFWVDLGNGEQQNYVETIELDPQSQYNLARRLLRKDMTELQMMDIFRNSVITHEDIVLASLETGYITLEDIEFVVKYDDLWNPSISKYQRISGFIFTVAGYSTFFLPPPWNITASIALGVIEGVVDNKLSNGAKNDNPATFIE